jgi:hypothetical protein
MRRIWAAITAGFLSTLLLPATAFAEQSGIAEEMRRRPGFFGGIFSFFGLLCCLVVVGGIVLIVYLVTRNRRS